MDERTNRLDKERKQGGEAWMHLLFLKKIPTEWTA
jgi:hypothetical protein